MKSTNLTSFSINSFMEKVDMTLSQRKYIVSSYSLSFQKYREKPFYGNLDVSVPKLPIYHAGQ